MSGLNGAAIFVIQTLGSLYLLIVLLRFILQLVRANFYNPLCQFIVKATQTLLKPMRRVIPSIFGLDMSSLVLAILVQMVVFAIVLTLSYIPFNILGLLREYDAKSKGLNTGGASDGELLRELLLKIFLL